MRSRDTDVMELTKHSKSSSEDMKHDIQVVTDIEVQVQDRSGNATGWQTPVQERSDEEEVKKVQRSDDILLKELI
jgi:hypothetical protein